MKPYDTCLICGRFQTFHIGHESLIETGLKLCDRVLILIGSAQECGTERNPFNINTRTKMLKEIYGDSPNIMIYGLSDMTNEIKESVVRGIFKVKYNTEKTQDTVSKLEQSINKIDNFSQANFGANTQGGAAIAAKKVAESNDPGVAAISSRQCAELYNLSIVSIFNLHFNLL